MARYFKEVRAFPRFSFSFSAVSASGLAWESGGFLVTDLTRRDQCSQSASTANVLIAILSLADSDYLITHTTWPRHSFVKKDRLHEDIYKDMCITIQSGTNNALYV